MRNKPNHLNEIFGKKIDSLNGSKSTLREDNSQKTQKKPFYLRFSPTFAFDLIDSLFPNDEKLMKQILCMDEINIPVDDNLNKLLVSYMRNILSNGEIDKESESPLESFENIDAIIQDVFHEETSTCVKNSSNNTLLIKPFEEFINIPFIVILNELCDKNQYIIVGIKYIVSKIKCALSYFSSMENLYCLILNSGELEDPAPIVNSNSVSKILNELTEIKNHENFPQLIELNEIVSLYEDSSDLNSVKNHDVESPSHVKIKYPVLNDPVTIINVKDYGEKEINVDGFTELHSKIEEENIPISKPSSDVETNITPISINEDCKNVITGSETSNKSISKFENLNTNFLASTKKSYYPDVFNSILTKVKTRTIKPPKLITCTILTNKVEASWNPIAKFKSSTIPIPDVEIHNNTTHQFRVTNYQTLIVEAQSLRTRKSSPCLNTIKKIKSGSAQNPKVKVPTILIPALKVDTIPVSEVKAFIKPLFGIDASIVPILKSEANSYPIHKVECANNPISRVKSSPVSISEVQGNTMMISEVKASTNPIPEVVDKIDQNIKMKAYINLISQIKVNKIRIPGFYTHFFEKFPKLTKRVSNMYTIFCISNMFDMRDLHLYEVFIALECSRNPEKYGEKSHGKISMIVITGSRTHYSRGKGKIKLFVLAYLGIYQMRFSKLSASSYLVTL